MNESEHWYQGVNSLGEYLRVVAHELEVHDDGRRHYVRFPTVPSTTQLIEPGDVLQTARAYRFIADRLEEHPEEEELFYIFLQQQATRPHMPDGG